MLCIYMENCEYNCIFYPFLIFLYINLKKLIFFFWVVVFHCENLTFKTSTIKLVFLLSIYIKTYFKGIKWYLYYKWINVQQIKYSTSITLYNQSVGLIIKWLHPCTYWKLIYLIIPHLLGYNITFFFHFMTMN